MECKKSCIIQVLCANIPEELQIILQYIRNLKFEKEPDYEILRNPLKELFYKHNYKYDLIFDWSIRNEIKD